MKTNNNPKGKKIKQQITLTVNDEILPIRNHDWERLKKEISKIKSPSKFISFIYASLWGAAITIFFTLFSLPKETSVITKLSFIVILIGVILIAIILMIIEKKWMKIEKRDVSDILSEMASIKKLSSQS